MKATGIVRRIDELGRLVIPKEIRRVLQIKEQDAIEIWVDDEKIILQKYVPRHTKTYDELAKEIEQLKEELGILRGHQIV